MTQDFMEQGGRLEEGLLSGCLTIDMEPSIGIQCNGSPSVTVDVTITGMTSDLMGHTQVTTINQSLNFPVGLTLSPVQVFEAHLFSYSSSCHLLHKGGFDDTQK